MIEKAGRFFQSSSHTQDVRPTFIHVGGEQFHAAAVALIDCLRIASVQDGILKKIVTSYYQYFPQAIPIEPYLVTIKERMSRLLNNPRKSELVECMAYVLRQLTVDELYRHYLKLEYRPIFRELNEKTSANYLRDPQTRLPVSALEALSHALGLPITLSFKELGKELRRCDQTQDSLSPGLLIQIQNGCYYPAVKHPGEFLHVGQLKVVIKPTHITSNQEENLKSILDLIKADNHSLLHSYEQQRHKILCMLGANELTHTQLVDLYCSLLPDKTNNSEFVMELTQLEHPSIAATPASLDQALASALASWISAGLITQEQLFDSADNPALLTGHSA